jgi:hypothetical protein
MGDVIALGRRAPKVRTRRARINGRDLVLVNEADAAKLLGVPPGTVMNVVQPTVLVVTQEYYDVDDVQAAKESKDAK